MRQTLKDEAQYGKTGLDIIGIGGMITTYGFCKEFIPWIRRDHPNAKIVVGGGCFTALKQDMMRWIPDIDYGVIGEGEKTIIELIRAVENNDSVKQIQGLIYREDDEIVENPPRSLMAEQELDELPYPAWHLLAMEETYFPNSPLPLSAECLRSRRRLNILASRGCPYQCTFCHDLMTGQSRTNYHEAFKIRFHSPHYIVDYIKAMRIKYAIDFVSFIDENFTVRKDRVYEICDLLEEEGLSEGLLGWGCTAHVKTVNPEMLARMRECGCSYLDFGFESMDNNILNDIKKNATAEENERALKWTLDAKINPITNFMTGYPNMTVESILADMKFWKKHGIRCKPFFITPFPKTELFEENKERILAQFDGDYEKFILEICGEATDLHVNLTKYSDPELIGVRELMFNHDIKRLENWGKLKGELKDG